MTLIWNLDHYLSLKRGMRWFKKIWQSHHVNKVILVVICPSFSQFGAACKPNSGCMIHIYYFFINNNLLSNRTKESLTQPSYYWLKKRYHFGLKLPTTCEKWGGPANIKYISWYCKCFCTYLLNYKFLAINPNNYQTEGC